MARTRSSRIALAEAEKLLKIYQAARWSGVRPTAVYTDGLTRTWTPSDKLDNEIVKKFSTLMQALYSQTGMSYDNKTTTVQEEKLIELSAAARKDLEANGIKVPTELLTLTKDEKALLLSKYNPLNEKAQRLDISYQEAFGKPLKDTMDGAFLALIPGTKKFIDESSREIAYIDREMDYYNSELTKIESLIAFRKKLNDKEKEIKQAITNTYTGDGEAALFQPVLDEIAALKLKTEETGIFNNLNATVNIPYGAIEVGFTNVKDLIAFRRELIAKEAELKIKIRDTYTGPGEKELFDPVLLDITNLKARIDAPGARDNIPALRTALSPTIVDKFAHVENLIKFRRDLALREAALKDKIKTFPTNLPPAADSFATEALFPDAFTQINALKAETDGALTAGFEDKLKLIESKVTEIGKILTSLNEQIKATLTLLSPPNQDNTVYKENLDKLKQLHTTIVSPEKIKSILAEANKEEAKKLTDAYLLNIKKITKSNEDEKKVLATKSIESRIKTLKQGHETYLKATVFEPSTKFLTPEQKTKIREKFTAIKTRIEAPDLATKTDDTLKTLEKDFDTLKEQIKQLNSLRKDLSEIPDRLDPSQKAKFSDLTKDLKADLEKPDAIDKLNTLAEKIDALETIRQSVALRREVENLPVAKSIDFLNELRLKNPVAVQLREKYDELISKFKKPDALTKDGLEALEREFSSLKAQFNERKDPQARLGREVDNLISANTRDPVIIANKDSFKPMDKKLAELRENIRKGTGTATDWETELTSIKNKKKEFSAFLTKIQPAANAVETNADLSVEQKREFKARILALKTKPDTYENILTKDPLNEINEKIAKLIALKKEVEASVARITDDKILSPTLRGSLLTKLTEFQAKLIKKEALETFVDDYAEFEQLKPYIKNLSTLAGTLADLKELKDNLSDQLVTKHAKGTEEYKKFFTDLNLEDLERRIEAELTKDLATLTKTPETFARELEAKRTLAGTKLTELGIGLDAEALKTVAGLKVNLQELRNYVTDIKRGFEDTKTKFREAKIDVDTISSSITKLLEDISKLERQAEGPEAKKQIKEITEAKNKLGPEITKLEIAIREAMTTLTAKEKEKREAEEKAKREEAEKAGKKEEVGDKDKDKKEEGKKEGVEAAKEKGDGLTAAEIDEAYVEKLKKLTALKDSAIEKFKAAGMGKLFHSDNGLFKSLERAMVLLRIAPNNKNLQELERIQAVVVDRMQKFIDDISKNEKDKTTYKDGLAALKEFKDESEKFINEELRKHKKLVPVYKGIRSERIEVKDSEDSTFEAKLAEVMGEKGKKALLEMSDDTIDGRARYIEDIDATHFMKNQIGDVVWTERLDKQKVIRSQAFELPEKLQPEKIWANMYKLVQAAGLGTKITEEDFQSIYKHLRDSNQPIDKDHIIKQFERRGIKNEGVFTRNISELAGNLRDQYRETYQANLSQKIKGATYPSDLVINTMKAFIDSMLAKDPKAEIVLNKLPSAQFAIAAFLYVEILNRDPARKQKIFISDQSGFQISRGDVLTQKGFSLQTFNSLLYRDTIQGKSLEDSRLETRATNYVRSAPGRSSGGGS